MVIELNTENKLEYKFYPNHTQAVKFKVKAANDAHIAIAECPIDGLSEGKSFYEIFLGGWKNTKSGIRKDKTAPSEPLVTELIKPNILSPDEFRSFWITWYDGRINVGCDENATAILKYEDPNLRGSFVGFRTGWGSTGSWVIEDSWCGWKPPGQAEWVKVSGNKLPGRAIPAGSGANNELLFIGRAMHEGALTPGRVVPSQGKLYLPWGGVEHIKTEFEVLTGCNAKWVPAQKDKIPDNALRAGTTENGEPLYVGRAKHGSKIPCGKVQKSHKVCYVSDGGKEHAYENFEVMVLGDDAAPSSFTITSSSSSQVKK